MKKIFFIGLSLFVVGLFVTVFMLWNNQGIASNSTPVKIHKAHEGKEIKNVDVSSQSVDIEFYPSTKDQIEATLSGVKQKNMEHTLQMVNNGQTLEIQSTQNQKNPLWVNFNLDAIQNPVKLKVLLPSKQYQSLTVQTRHGNISLDQYQGKSIKMTSENGDIKLKNAIASFSLHTDHGNIAFLSSVAFQGENSITTGNGDIKIPSGIKSTSSGKALTSQLRLQSDHGHITLSGYQGGSLNATTRNGDIQLQNIDANFNIKSEHGNIGFNSIPAFYGKNQLSTEHGNIHVQVRNELAPLIVDLQADSVQSDFPITTTSTGDTKNTDKIRKGIIGKATAQSPQITMKSDNGDISLKK